MHMSYDAVSRISSNFAWGFGLVAIALAWAGTQAEGSWRLILLLLTSLLFVACSVCLGIWVSNDEARRQAIEFTTRGSGKEVDDGIR